MIWAATLRELCLKACVALHVVQTWLVLIEFNEQCLLLWGPQCASARSTQCPALSKELWWRPSLDCELERN